ncbi:hypothetical protein, partial [Methylacidimicrobium cyclopophantes]|uniref:hypothetical protein n=1 Tax=Methylacidimicrobium cyclopophantes TaxID=1041766 RepID=UPI0015B564EA
PEPHADFGWRREEVGDLDLFCARHTLPEADLFLFSDPPTRAADLRAALSFLEKGADAQKTSGRTLEASSFLFEREESVGIAGRTSPGKGLPGLSPLRLSSQELLDLSAAVSLLFSFRPDPSRLPIEEEIRCRAEGILASWRARLPIPHPTRPMGKKDEELSLPLLEAVRDAIRAKRILPLAELLERLPRRIGREQALSAAGVLSEVQVRTGPSFEPLFFWQLP